MPASAIEDEPARGPARALRAWAVAASLLIALAGPALAQSAQIQTVRFGEDHGVSRAVLDFTAPVDFTIAAEGTIVRVLLNGNGRSQSHSGEGVLKQADIRVGSGIASVLISAARPVRIERVLLLPPEAGSPYRLAIDVVPGDRPLALSPMTIPWRSDPERARQLVRRDWSAPVADIRTAASSPPASGTAAPAAPGAAAAAPPRPPRPPLPEGGPVQERLDALFERMMDDPADLDTTFAYARLATEAGDYEAAITAYERLLIINPDLPRVRYELGVLYYQLKSFDLARVYLQRALAGDDVPPDVRARATQLLGQVEQTTVRSRFSGSLGGGVRYQTNANSGTSSPIIRARGEDAQLTSAASGRGDANIFFNGLLRHSYDLQTENDASIESDLLGYITHQFHESALNLGVVEGRSGVRFRPMGDDPMSIRPFILLGGITLGDNWYSNAAGFGLDAARPITSNLALEGTLDERHVRFYNAGTQTTLSDSTGWQTGVQLRGRYTIAADQVATLDFAVRNADAQKSSAAYTEYSITAGYTWRFPAPGDLTELPWSLTASAGRVMTDYGGPDPLIDPRVTRRDRQWRLSLTPTVPLAPQWSGYAQFEQDLTSSTLPNFKYNNFVTILGVNRSF